MDSDFLKNLNDALSNLPFWFGVVSVGAFAYSRFDVSLPDADELSPPLRPSSFTTAFRFWHAACTYFGIYALVYLVLLIIGTIPSLRTVLADLPGMPTDSAGDVKIGTPAWAALVATAVLPAMPVVGAIDKRVRRFLQDFASIPTKARMLAQEVLSLVEPAEPHPCDQNTTLEGVVAAIKAHKERSERIFDVCSQLADNAIVAPGVSRRYEEFFRGNEKTVAGFKQVFTATADGYATLESARSVEHKYLVEVRKVARFLVCAILQAEMTELGARARLRALGFNVRLIGIEFRPGLIVLSFSAIFFMTLVGSYLSASLYYIFGGHKTYAYLTLLKDGTGIFFIWSLSSILFYTIPVAFAAGATMYVLDRKATALDGDSTAITTAVVLTFVGSAVVSLFILLPTTFLTARLQGSGARAMSLLELLPWIIPPAFMATTFMYMSSSWQEKERWISDISAYVLLHGLAAAIAGVCAFGLWYATGATYDPKCCNNLPEPLFYYLVPITTFLIGAGVGRVLAGTRKEARAV